MQMKVQSGFYLVRTGEITNTAWFATRITVNQPKVLFRKSYKATLPNLINLRQASKHHMGLKGQCYTRAGRRNEYQNVIAATTVEELPTSMPIKNDLKLSTILTESIKGNGQTSNQRYQGDTVYFGADGKIYKVKASVSDDLPHLKW